MIQKTIIYECRFCHSAHIVKNGHNAQGHQQYWCKNCGKRTVLELRPRYTEEK
ncbi:MAG: IS1 family transposase, partial [Chloroflexi bacterium]|nr:IS1 family transposase [Chloroflexota bacterium]